MGSLQHRGHDQERRKHRQNRRVGRSLGDRILPVHERLPESAPKPRKVHGFNRLMAATTVSKRMSRAATRPRARLDPSSTLGQPKQRGKGTARRIQGPPHIRDSPVGVGGTSYELVFGRNFVQARFKWWCDAPSGWAQLAALSREIEMIVESAIALR